MAKVFIGVGHGGNDPGASKYLVEKDINLVMALACQELLEKNGVQVLMSRTKDENDPLSEEIVECNAFNPDLAIDIHNNAGGGDGFEIYYHTGGGTSKTLAFNIEQEVIAIGQNSRGCKTKTNASGRDYYGFIRQTKAPSVITEGLFVDNATDVGKVIVNGQFGWYCSSDDEKKVVELIEEVARKDNCDALGENAYSYLKNNFAIEIAYDSIIKCMEQK